MTSLSVSDRRPAGPPGPYPHGAVFDQLLDGVLVTDAALEAPGGVRTVYVNAALCEMTGYAPQELIGRSPGMLQGEETDPALVGRLGDELRAGRGFQGQGTNYRKDGSPFTMEWSISPIAEQGATRWFVAIQRDGTLPARQLLAARREAHIDPLTGLPNRRHLDDALRGGAWLSSRTRAAIVLDIDHFKAVNDTHGHVVGDEVLAEVGRRLQASVRGSDLLARWGGEEFCVLTGGKDGGGTGVLAQRLLDAIGGRPVPTSAGALPVTVSIGWASVSEQLECAMDLLQAADVAMYAAKQAGRNRVRTAPQRAERRSS